MPRLKTYNLFISHAWSYADHYARLVALLGKAPRFKFKNYSVPRDDPVHTNGTDEELRAAIRQQMQPCHVILVVAGMYVHYRRWIRAELDLAKSGFSEAKPVLLIRPWGSRKIPEIAVARADEIVRWRRSNIVDAIRRLAI